MQCDVNGDVGDREEMKVNGSMRALEFVSSIQGGVESSRREHILRDFRWCYARSTVDLFALVLIFLFPFMQAPRGNLVVLVHDPYELKCKSLLSELP